MIYLYITLFILLSSGGVYLYIKNLQKTISKQKKKLEENNILISNLNNQIEVIKKDNENKEKNASTLIKDKQAVDGAKTNEEKNKAVSSIISDFYNNK